MMVRPFGLDQLVSVSATGRDVVRTAAARLGGLDQRAELRLAPFGAVSLRCLEVTVPLPPHHTDAIWVLSRDGNEGHEGYVILDGLAALRVVAATLGLPSPRGARSLGDAERGVATATIASVLRSVARDVRVSLAPRTWRPDGLARLTIGIDFGRFFERARIDVPPEWLPPIPGLSLVAEATRRGLGIPLTVELARTTVAARDWSRARLGDAIVFDDWTAIDANCDWPVRVTCGEFSAAALVGADRLVRMTSAFRRSEASQPAANESFNSKSTGRDTMSSDDRLAASLTMLASAPIQIVAEIGRFVLRADEIITLGAGSVLSIGPLRPTTVDLRVGDRRWAQGELVDVDGQLGIRVTTLEPGTERLVPSAEAETRR